MMSDLLMGMLLRTHSLQHWVIRN